MRPSRWLSLVAVVAVLAAGGYLLLGRSGTSGAFTPYQSGPAPQGDGLTPGRPVSSPLPPGFKVLREEKVIDLNSASLEELQTISVITPEYARKIVAGRPYQRVDDLSRLGFSHQLLEQISPPAMVRPAGLGSPPPPVPTPNPSNKR